MTPIIVVDGSKQSLDLAEIMIKGRPGTPLLIFPMYWPINKLRMVKEFADRHNVQAFFFSPQKVEIKGDRVIAEYRTDKTFHTTDEPIEPNTLEKVLTFEPSGIPAFMWSETWQ